MRGIFVCTLALATICGVFTQNPGAQYRLTEEGLNWGIKTGLNLADKLVIGREWPAFGHTFKTLRGNTITYEIRKLKIDRVDGGDASMSVGNGDVTSSAKGLGGKLSADYSFTYEGPITRSDSGHLSLDFNVDALLTAGTTADRNGRPFITLNDCAFGLNNLDYDLTGEYAEEHKKYIDEFLEERRDTIGDDACDGLLVLLEKGINPLLAKTPMQVAVPKVGVFDFHLTSDPVAENKYVEVYHKAQFFGIEDFSDPPFEAATFPSEPASHMVTLWASDFVANSFFYVFKEQMRIQITPELLGEHGDYLKLNCDGVCFGTILPQDVVDMYPNGVAVINLWATEQPVLTITPEAAKGVVAGQMQVYVRDGGKDHFLFSSELNSDASVFVEMEGKKVKFEVKTLNARLNFIDNEVDELEEDDLNMLIRLGLSTFVKPYINKIGADGVELPTPEDIPYSNAKITLYDHTLVAKVDGGL